MQWEFAGRLGPPPGRYVVRRFAGDEAQSVVVITEATAPRRIGRRESPESVPVTRVTVIDADALFDDATGSAWLRDAGVSADAIATFARVVAAYRVAAADPFLADLDVNRAWRVRVGFGTGEQVAEGAWTESRELPRPQPPAPPRRSKHRPADRLAALLSGRDVALACEDLTLRARLDLDLRRHHEAALQLEAALSCALAELVGFREQGDLAKRLLELETYLPDVSAAAAAAREGRLETETIETLSTALSRLEAALRARALYTAEGEG